MRPLFAASLLFVLLAAPPAEAQKKKGKSNTMDYGPFLSATYRLQWPQKNLALRGVAVPFADGGVIFDTELLRYAGAWTGGFIKMEGVVFNGAHGTNPSPAGTQVLGTKPTPGWAKGGDWKDPRPIPHGPLPRNWARFKGMYRTDDGVIFSYTVGDCQVLDMPTHETHGAVKLFCRTLNLKASAQALTMVVADVDGAKDSIGGGDRIVLVGPKGLTGARVVGGPKGTKLESVDKGTRIVLRLPALKEDARIKVYTYPITGTGDDLAAVIEKLPGPANLAPLTRGGKARWTESVVTKGKRSDDSKGAYVIDDITVPFNNPYKSWMRVGGFDFFSDGRAAVCTWSGDVWIVSGIDDKLDKITWKRFATGLFQPLGLKIVKDQVYTLGRDGVTRLHDLNGDGEADFYECFNNDFYVTQNFHEFIFDLHTDPEGNFYFVKGGPVRPGGRGWDPITPHHGSMFKLYKDGSRLEVIARGFRAPNGMCVGPNGELTCGDNEGTWTPMCPINWVRPGGFYGVPDFSDRKPKPTVRDNPLCWLPKEVDNSNGGQVWITGKRFGPLSGQLLHTSYGTSTLFLVLKEEVRGQMQGGVVPLLKFDSGVCRVRFYEDKNALFLTGIRGWQTNAARDAGFYRVRYTGKKANLPVGLNVRPDGIKITFSDPLDRKAATDVDNYNVQQWNYRWLENYGSPHFKVSDPKKQGHDDVEVESAALSPDGKTVTLKIDKLRPVMQMKIAYTLKMADGTAVRSAIHHTINAVGNLRGELHPGELRMIRVKE